MSRIRSVHPGLFTDEAFMAASTPARLLLIGLWCEAWDDGVFDWKPLTLKVKLFPADAVEVGPLLDELANLNFIKRFEVDGKAYGVIRNFQRYQRPKKPNSSGVFPNEFRTYAGSTSVSNEPVRNQPPTGSEPVLLGEEDGGGRMEGEDGEKIVQLHPEKPETPVRAAASRSSRARDGYAFESGTIRLTKADFEKWRVRFSAINLEGELTGLTGFAERETGEGRQWFHAVAGALAKRDREARANAERFRVEAQVAAQENRTPRQRWAI